MISEIEKLKSLGFNVDNLTKEEIEELKECIITISENEENYKIENTNSDANNIDNKSISADISQDSFLFASQRKIIENNKIKVNKENLKRNELQKENEKEKGKVGKNQNKTNQINSFVNKKENERTHFKKEQKNDYYFNKIKELEEKLNKEVQISNQLSSSLQSEKDENKIKSIEIEKLKVLLNTTTNESRLKEEIIQKHERLVNGINLDEELRKIGERNEKINKLNSICDSFEKEITQMRKEIEEKTCRINDIQKENEELKRKFDVKSYEIDNLIKDKLYLLKEKDMNEEKSKLLKGKIINLEEEIVELRKSNQKYIEKISDKTHVIENEYQNKLNNELKDIKERQKDDVDNIKRLYEDVISTKIKYLEEERTDLKARIALLESKLNDKVEEIDMQNNEFRLYKTKSNEEIYEFKIKLKLKEEDYNRLYHLYTELESMIDKNKAEKEMLLQKNDILKKELFNKEIHYKEELSGLKSEITILKDTKASYDRMEDELDKVILDSTINENDNLYDEDIMGMIKTIPSLSKRRINQCLVLAQKVKQENLKNLKLSSEISKKEEEIINLNKEKEAMKKVIDNINQPSFYLIRRIEEIEYELMKTKENLIVKEKEVKIISDENIIMNRKIENLLGDLKNVVNNRKKIDDVEELILNLVNKSGICKEKVFNGKDYDINIGSINENKSKNIYDMQKSIPIVIDKSQGEFIQSKEYDNQIEISNGNYPNWYISYKKNKSYKNQFN